MNDLMEKIKEILRDDWAPLGKGCRADEYDSYAPVIHFILTNNVSSKRNHLSYYLFGIEVCGMNAKPELLEIRSDAGYLTTVPSVSIQKTVQRLIGLVEADMISLYDIVVLTRDIVDSRVNEIYREGTKAEVIKISNDTLWIDFFAGKFKNFGILKVSKDAVRKIEQA